MKKLIILSLLIVSSLSFAQKISGTVYDGEFNEPMPFANVLVKGSSTGTTTDFDGYFEFDVVEGEYTLVFSFVGYETKEISNVIVATSGTDIDVVLNPSSNALEEVVVTTTAKRNSETSVLNIQKRSVRVLDGLSIQTIKKSGDSDIASAVKRIPGVSVQEGKFVYVRGLGDRYSKITLNGLDVPGLDPNKNTLQLDVFPTSIIDNLIANKSASADLDADFTGGIVDVVLRDYSSVGKTSVKFSSSYNPDMHFNDNYIEDFNSSTDWLGVDDGKRDLPFDRELDYFDRPTRDKAKSDSLTMITRSFTKMIRPIQNTSSMNYGVSASHSNSFSLGDTNSIGLIAAVSYANETAFFENAESGDATFNTDVGDDRLRRFKYNRFNLGKNSILTSQLLGLSYNSLNSKISVALLNLNKGESQAKDGLEQGFDENVYTALDYGLYYTERNLLAIPISGSHKIVNDVWAVDWKYMHSKSKVHDKDFRTALILKDPIGQDEYNYGFDAATTSAGPERIWRYLDEFNDTYKINSTFNLEAGKTKLTTKIGLFQTQKERTFKSDYYQLLNRRMPRFFEFDFIDRVYDEEFTYTHDTLTGYYMNGGIDPFNEYESRSVKKGYYFNQIIDFNSSIQLIAGIRNESFKLMYTGLDAQSNEYDDVVFLNENEFFPSASLNFTLKEKTKFRLSYYKTTARPSFREASTAYIFDPITKFRYLGGFYDPNGLKSSLISNFDFRIEKYGTGNNFAALSVFYKTFENPIEIGVWNYLFARDLIPRNNNDATIKGIEFDFRRNFKIDDINSITLNLNSTIVESELKISDEEFESKELFYIIVDKEVQEYRRMQGQSDYVVNTSAVYRNSNWRLEGGLFFNVQGDALYSVGNGEVPDAYTVPFNSLNLNLKKEFGDNVVKRITFKINNILDEENAIKYKFFDKEPITASLFKPGTTFSLSYSVSF